MSSKQYFTFSSWLAAYLCMNGSATSRDFKQLDETQYPMVATWKKPGAIAKKLYSALSLQADPDCDWLLSSTPKTADGTRIVAQPATYSLNEPHYHAINNYMMATRQIFICTNVMDAGELTKIADVLPANKRIADDWPNEKILPYLMPAHTTLVLAALVRHKLRNITSTNTAVFGTINKIDPSIDPNSLKTNTVYPHGNRSTNLFTIETDSGTLQIDEGISIYDIHPAIACRYLSTKETKQYLMIRFRN